LPLSCKILIVYSELHFDSFGGIRVQRFQTPAVIPGSRRSKISSLKEAEMKTAEDILKEKDREMVCVSSDSTVRKALNLMTTHRIGAILVKTNDEIAGIWTERDLLHNINIPEFNPDTDRIGDYMTSPLHSAAHNTSILKIKEMFLGLFIRHILVEKDGEYIGMLSIGDVLRASLMEQDRQIKELNAIASWEYYENWGWDRRKKKK